MQIQNLSLRMNVQAEVLSVFALQVTGDAQGRVAVRLAALFFTGLCINMILF